MVGQTQFPMAAHHACLEGPVLQIHGNPINDTVSYIVRTCMYNNYVHVMLCHDIIALTSVMPIHTVQ